MWRVIWTGPASRDMRRLDQNVARRIREAVRRLGEQERGDIRRLRGQEQEWRLRVGDWRVIFTYDDQEHTIYVGRVLHRREAYR